MKKDNSKLWLLSAGLALPGLALVIALFATGHIKFLYFLLNIPFELVCGFTFAYAIIGMVSLHRFVTANPSYKNYASKSGVLITKLFVAALCCLFVAKLIIYVVQFFEQADNWYLSYAVFMPCYYMPFIYSYHGLISDENLYIAWCRETIPIEKIRVDDFSALEAAMNRFDEYIKFKFHAGDKPYEAVLPRKTLVDLCKVLPGVNRDYGVTPNPKKTPQKFY